MLLRRTEIGTSQLAIFLTISNRKNAEAEKQS